MAEFKRKNTNNFWQSPLVLLALFCILVIFMYNMIGLFEKERETSKKKEQILTNIETLRNREKILNADLEKLKTEDGIEETIRDKFQVVKQDEKMVTIVDEDKKEEEAPSVTTDHTFSGWFKRTFKL